MPKATGTSPDTRCRKTAAVHGYALQGLREERRAAFEAHIAGCVSCRLERESLRPVIDRFVAWPTDVLRPPTRLGDRLALRIGQDTGEANQRPTARRWTEPDWEQVAPGIQCKLLATDGERHRVSMLVRLAPGARYPAHTHAAVEELHLLDGELWIDGRKLNAGDYNHGVPGTTDRSVWSETGCTCLLITSTGDLLGSPAAERETRPLGRS
jgi:anti-sigma factor ChrR (cupin superfamily)